MNDDKIKIKLNPFLGNSKNFIENFYIIGYDEKMLSKYCPNIIENKNNLKLSIISSIMDIDEYVDEKRIKQIYPNPPNIIKKTNSMVKPTPTNIIFYSCFDALDGRKKIILSFYALRFYEEYKDRISNNEYYIPKAFLIYSQYTYFTAFQNICSLLLSYNEKENKIPIEIFIYLLIKNVPSPIKSNIILNNFEHQISIPKLTGYPYINFNLSKIFNLMPINEFIKIFILTFLEIGIFIVSPYLENLNMFMFILYILNYPLIDSYYYWHIKSISKNELKNGDDSLNNPFKGVNEDFNFNLDFSNFRNLDFIIDMENKKKPIIKIKETNYSEDIILLLDYINNILNEKKVNSSFLFNCINSLKINLKNIKKEYDIKIENNIPNTFFYVNNDIIQINRKIQEAFYDFNLNIILIFYKLYQYDISSSKIIRQKNDLFDLAKEENIFFKIFQNTIKFNTYFELFITNFKSIDEINISNLFFDEFASLCVEDENKITQKNINKFKIIDDLYSTKKEI